MSSATGATHQDQAAPGVLRSFPWSPWLWFGALLFLCYAPVLVRLVGQWIGDEDMGHGFFVPIVAGFIIWQRRDELAAVKPESSWWGLAIIVWGAVQLYLATLGAELFMARLAFVISLVGVVVYLGGWPFLRILRFPLFLLLFMIPIPAILYNQITFPLQILASRMGEVALSACGVPVLRNGNILELPSQQLQVVEACSGIRSLLTLSFLSLVYSYFFDKKVWMRPVLLVLTVPIAIVANASRVTLSGLLSGINPELAEGLYHTISGWVIFMIALALLIAVHAVINRIYRLAHD